MGGYVHRLEAIVIATEWEQFRALDFDRLRDLMVTPVLVDLRNIYRPEDVQRRGFAYAGVGRSACNSIQTSDIPNELMWNSDKCERALI